jgi:CheY-like chemotaxis protein/signal transduction histidine kinase
MARQFPRMDRVFKALAFACGLACVMAVAGWYGRIAVALNVLWVLFAVCVVALCAVLLRRNRHAWPTLVGYSVYLLTGVMHFAKNLQWLPFTLATQYSYAMAAIAHVLAFFFALGWRVRHRERKALALSRRHGARLEQRVHERTRDLRQEVTDHQRTHEQLTLALREQKGLLAMVSHEFRTPLGTIGGVAQMLSDERLGLAREEVKSEAEKITRTVLRMRDLVDTLLADEWLEASSEKMSPVPIELADFLGEKIGEHNEGNARGRISLALDAPRVARAGGRDAAAHCRRQPADQRRQVRACAVAGVRACRVPARPARHHRACRRYLMRAHPGVRPGPRLQAARPAARVRTLLSRGGRAAPPRNRPGAAHGAADCQAPRRQRHRGQSARGRRRAHADAAAAGKRRPAGARGWRPSGELRSARFRMAGVIRVLVIEDDDDLRDTLVRYLCGVGMPARGVASAEEVDAELARQDFDAAVCDVNLPGEDGFAVLARLRSRSAMRIVMLTARGLANDRLRGLGLGADYYLVKPVNLRELEMVLRNLLQRSQEAQGVREPAEKDAEETGVELAAGPAVPSPWRFQSTDWVLLAPTASACSSRARRRGWCTASSRGRAKSSTGPRCLSPWGARAWRPTNATSTSPSRGCAARPNRLAGRSCRSSRCAGRATASREPDASSREPACNAGEQQQLERRTSEMDFACKTFWNAATLSCGGERFRIARTSPPDHTCRATLGPPSHGLRGRAMAHRAVAAFEPSA